MKNSDAFVKVVKKNKSFFAILILIAILISIVTCFLCAIARADEIQKNHQNYAYKTETGWAVYSNPPDQKIETPPAEWDFSSEDQKKLITGEKK